MTSTPEEAALNGEGHDILCQEYGTETAVHDTENGCSCGTLFIVRINEIQRTIDVLNKRIERYTNVLYSRSAPHRAKFGEQG
jgi:hypothetical protein